MNPRLLLCVVTLAATGCSAGTVTGTPTLAPASATPKAATAPPTDAPKPTATRATTPPTLAPTSAPPTTPSPTPTATAGSPITIDGDVVTIDPSALVPLFYEPPATGSSDPFYFIHTTPEVDGFFLSIEAYTVYGPDWTGQLGTFDIDCTAGGTGICVHFDPDGPGPMPDLGADFAVTGQITFTVLEQDAFDVTLEDVAFSDGTVIPGPLNLASS